MKMLLLSRSQLTFLIILVSIQFPYSVRIMEDFGEILEDIHHVGLDIVETGQVWRDTIGQRGSRQWSSSMIVETETFMRSVKPPFHC